MSHTTPLADGLFFLFSFRAGTLYITWRILCSLGISRKGGALPYLDLTGICPWVGHVTGILHITKRTSYLIKQTKSKVGYKLSTFVYISTYRRLDNLWWSGPPFFVKLELAFKIENISTLIKQQFFLTKKNPFPRTGVIMKNYLVLYAKRKESGS